MSRLTILGSTFVFASIISGIALYKLEIRKTSINEEYEYIKKHRVFGSLTKYLSIISLISLVLLILKIIIDRNYTVIVSYGSIWTIFTLVTLCTGYFQKRDSIYYNRGLIAAFSMLMFITVCIYAFRKVLF
ncbi:hypothetical protein VCHSUH04_00080 [Veillonella sp. T14073-2]|uniref:hypothetical protein n=1 Tax=Veillonella sp. T14073-2 TaxID=1911680 RepID=UPI000CF364EF|nr:hypothetical protein [Veillonella sp. T14073-2]PQL23503.1 hypothetical protein VCHSUH04_00080 [Veillonella sp. T14073-2]